jgi:acyl-CoA synthetase (AMP-forming)/AMP-acid ligase II
VPTIYRSPFPDVTIPDVPLTTHVLRHAATRPDVPALVDGPTGRTLTFAQLEGAVRALAGGLAARGFAPGDVVGLMAPNLPEYAVVFHGVATAGGTVTTVNPLYTAEEVRHQLLDSGASSLVTVPPFLDTARAAVKDTAVDEIVVIGEAEGATPLAAWMGDPIEQVGIDPAEHVVVLPYSSGTTGLPKGVMLTHRNLVANIAQCEPVLDLGDDEVALAVLPFFHIYGMQVLMNMMLAVGATVVTLPRFDLGEALRLIEERRVTRFFVVPPIVLALAKQPVVDQFDLSSLRFVLSGAAPLGADLAQDAAARIGCEVVQGYGMTELSPVSHATPAGQFKPGSVGVLVPNAQARLVGAAGDDRGVGEEGELWIRGPLVMKGYLNNPAATAATIDDEGWLHTGDVARIDEDGHTYIVDRVKELIKYKAFQVPPAELEALLVTHPGVADVAVVGIPDEEAGELPKAFVVRRPDSDVTAEELQAFVAEHVAHYKQVRSVAFVDEIPKSASGKILRRLLRDG